MRKIYEGYYFSHARYLETAKLIQSKYRYEICNGLKQYKRKEVYYEQSIKI